ncbi:MAG TPA: hypothetical protein VH309_05875 [Elusimicrobiota bacterium]|nr:hypothetical protein [Elusimicrobiota bacterium]
MRSAAGLAALLALAAPARAAEEPVDCPAGMHQISTDNPYQPFRCVSAAQDDKEGFDAVVGPKGFKTLPRCPRGTRPVVETGNSLQPYRCVRADDDAQDPELAPMRGDGDDAPAPPPAETEDDPLTKGCPKGERKVRTTDPLNPYHCVAQSSRMHTLDEGSYGRFSIPGQISFDYASAFRVQDSWKDDVPTLYLKIDDSSAGKPVTITITRCVDSQSTYEEMSDAIGHDVEWLGAKDGGTLLVGRARARLTYIPGDTRSVYLPATKESYYSFVYSAPADSYEIYLPAFARLLKTLKLGGSAQ